MHFLIEAKSLLSSPGKMIGEQYKIIGIAQAETIRHKRDLWTFIERSLRIKKDILRHLVKTESMWVDQVRFELKYIIYYTPHLSLCINNFLTVPLNGAPECRILVKIKSFSRRSLYFQKFKPLIGCEWKYIEQTKTTVQKLMSISGLIADSY